MTSIVPTMRAAAPVPTMPVVISRPGRYVSTSTGWRNVASSRSHVARSSAGVCTSDLVSTPLPVPSASGLQNSGNGRHTPSMSAGVCTSANSGVGSPPSRSTRLVMPLCSVSASTRGSLKVYGIAYASRSAGTWASRPIPYIPSAMLNTRSQRSPATSRAARAFTWPMRSVR